MVLLVYHYCSLFPMGKIVLMDIWYIWTIVHMDREFIYPKYFFNTLLISSPEGIAMPPVIEKKREEFLKKEGAFASLLSLC